MPPLHSTADRESALLASYAMHSSQSRGRKYPEPEQSYRSPFQRDRDRIVHSHAFRRLAYKMQVFTGDMGDYHRSRLTHTHEVASIARTIGRALRLNEDLIEALALFHDIGHPPYGHAGEDALDECLGDHGGFSHNQNALTIAEELEIRYPAFPGLNLTYEVLEGQATRISHAGPAEVAGQRSEVGHPPLTTHPLPLTTPLLEVQVVEAADSMTYDAHDSDDAVKLGLVTLEELAEIPIIRQAVNSIRQRHGALSGDMLRKCIVHELLARQVTDVLHTASTVLAPLTNATADDVRRMPFRIGPSLVLAELKRELERFLYDRVYRHPRLIAVRSQAQERIRAMYDGYLSHPDLIPEHHRRRIAAAGIERTAADYIAGMTDRFCDALYERHFK
ncbi:MAG TPA: deoxyguanosinetriphosphate triphosphohydrolase [Pirellulaceae bacterium]|nr:deoxyguanosinetriphosphate triphosphohydrolase [Pirellulaceae bacterium]